EVTENLVSFWVVTRRRTFGAACRNLVRMVLRAFPSSWRKLLLILAGILVCLYAVSVLWYVQWNPDIGLRCAFHPTIQHAHHEYARTDNGRFRPPESGDTIVQVGDRPVESWPELLKALV